MKGSKGRADVMSQVRATKLLSKSKLPAKTDWHALSLQQLTTPEFVRVVNLILAEEYALIPDLFQEDGDASISGNPAAARDSRNASDGIWALTADSLAIEFI